jgi:hypothetical protein
LFSVGINESLNKLAMNEWLGLEGKRSLFLASLRVRTLYPLAALALLLFLKAPPANAQQVTHVPPFIGTYSETWERFGLRSIPSGTSILGGIATISGDHMETAHSFLMCSVMCCTIPIITKQRSGIYQGEHFLEELMGRPFPVGGR